MTRTTTRPALAPHVRGGVAPDRPGRRRRAPGRRAVTVTALVTVAGLALAGCSGDASATDSTTEAASAGTTTDDAASGGGAQDRGGVSGLVASVTDGVLQVQSDDSQTAVTVTGTTTVSRTVAATLADVTVGSCVVAVALPTGVPGSDGTDGTDGTDGMDGTDGTDGTAAGDAGSTEDADTDVSGGLSADGSAGPGSSGAVSSTATSVMISTPVDGACTVAGLGGGMPTGEMPDLPEGVAPTDMPTAPADAGSDAGAPASDDERPSGAMPGGFGGATSGLVTAVSGETITVDATGSDGTTTAATVTVAAGTSYTTTVAADASAIAVGMCASVQGETDTRGGMTAETLTLSDAVDGACTSGLPGARGGRMGAGTGDE